ncbi:uncharacterized protein BT62DRAFT_287582 [Guyanagaster necrorhizus]|uniref:Large ribosomal subunit protein mL40 n=1 Tax=Guyanagaster necrorhizus TaxID=856835 RepID=A0A9P8AYG3_9AGAR|nr:uncharacterized protein BT62DRAFT_287582 [Guyanagaster necrorhizus MCA 3950]KAG7452181.1 hypothetical protein BT62DRAFT_287582 [Guyanagaster necrorhizus MCA 3950]
MSVSVLGTSRRASVLSFVNVHVRGYARKPEETSDPKKEAIRRAMYPSNLRNRATPTGGWRRDVGRALQHAIPSVPAHETIERAWLLHKRHVRKQRDAELARKFECMKQAMEELAEIDPHLYYEANKTVDSRERSCAEAEVAVSMKALELKALDARIHGLFPREMRIPTDTPSRNGWNHDWKPFPRPL